MKTLSNIILSVALIVPTYASLAFELPPVPDDYPSHMKVGNCSREQLRHQLQDYNETRLALSAVLRQFAVDPAIQPDSRDRLIGYAANLEDKLEHLPPPNPDSDAFRNFDFHLGMTLTAIALFLNSEDPVLTERFVADRDDPDSELGIYLTELNSSRQRYEDRLATSRQPECQG